MTDDSVREPRETESTPADVDFFVRPYIMTSGRTIPVLDGLRIETMVHAAPAALSAPLRFEERAAITLCQEPHSVAEVAVALKVPIGVAKIVVSDLAAAGHLTVADSADLPLDTVERIRDLVRAL